MAQKPNYVSITVVCGRCRETILLPSDYASLVVGDLRSLIRKACDKDDISADVYANNVDSLVSFDNKYRILYETEE